MAVSIAAQLAGSDVPPVVQVVVTGLTGATQVSVWAEAPNSPRRVVRGGLEQNPSSDALVLVDTMPELGQPIIYVVEYLAAGVRQQLSASPVTVPDPGRHVLSDPFTGAAVLVDVLADEDERANAQRGSVLYPIGASQGVAVIDGREADAGTLTVYADAVTSKQLQSLLAPGVPIASRHPAHGCDLPAVEILNVSEAARRRRSRAGDRIHSLAFRVVSQPDPREPVALATLGELNDYYAPAGTLADLAAEFSTLLDIALSEWGG